ncbi:MAG: bifunctional nuclease family protein [Flavobacteriaceae bacterium]|jgi:bifunctional DNase/RNase|nr:bifunctional nuclease family protein [Flavobacteriaceae bacterium]NVJ72355.1 bifunctional nuclease family protein [Flavobacteriaceae bacterium]
MNLVPLKIKGISYSQTQNGAYALILTEIDGERKLPIVIGAFEAQSIAIALEKDIKPPRPLTHDLFKSFAKRFDIQLKKVIIHKLVDGVFYASIVCHKDGQEEVLDARTSDAIALALRFDTSIFTYESILEQAGIILDVKEADPKKIEAYKQPQQLPQDTKADPSLSKLSLDKLKEALEQAVQMEDYEYAAAIRDEISKRN